MWSANFALLRGLARKMAEESKVYIVFFNDPHNAMAWENKSSQSKLQEQTERGYENKGELELQKLPGVGKNF